MKRDRDKMGEVLVQILSGVCFCWMNFGLALMPPARLVICS